MRLASLAPTLSPILSGDDFVNQWVGVPFAWDGRTLRGVDCWGLVWRWHRDVAGIELPDWVKGARHLRWVWATLDEERANHWAPLEGPVDGCIVLCLAARRAHHVGIAWRGGVLHAAAGSSGVAWQAAHLFALNYPRLEFGRYAA